MRLLLGAVLLFSSPAAAGELDDLRARAIADYYRGRTTSAAQTFDRAVRVAPKDTLSWLDAAVAYRDLDRHKLSRRFFAKAAAMERKDPDVQAAYGWAALRAKRTKEARQAFRRALALAPDHPQALVGFAQINLRLGRLSAALKSLDHLRSTNPGFIPGHVLTGRALKRLGRIKEAVAAWEKAFKIDSTYTEMRLQLAPLYEKLKRINDAWKQYALILNVSPRHAEARREHRRLGRKLTKKPSDIMPKRSLKRHRPTKTAAGSARMPVIRVAIGTTVGGFPAPKTRIAFTSNVPFEVIDPESKRRLAEGPAKAVWIARRVRRGKNASYELINHKNRRVVSFRKVISVRPKDLKNGSIIFQRLNIQGGTAWEMQGDRQLKGIVELRALGGRGLYLINQLPLEDYLYGVVNEEMPERFPVEALKAQAVIARNHAVQLKRRMTKFNKYHYDLCDGQKCQVYSGVSGESEKGRRAVDATRGQVLKYRGRLAETPYSSNDGGHSQDSGELKTWTRLPYLKGRKDNRAGYVEVKSPWQLDQWLKKAPKTFCSGHPYAPAILYRWARVLAASELGDRLRRRTRRFGGLRHIRVLKRSKSGNINKVLFIGTRGRLIIDKEQRVRGIFGVSSARSTMFTIEVDRNAKGVPTDIHLSGGGWGHGVGLCQIGAAGRAAAGQDFKTILSHYFPGTKLASLNY
ncbi:MAG: SpoIID/LytB domain-containing protein, partial [Elusimicrobiota bacterium]